mgnify:CR=1 FL=1
MRNRIRGLNMPSSFLIRAVMTGLAIALPGASVFADAYPTSNKDGSPKFNYVPLGCSSVDMQAALAAYFAASEPEPKDGSTEASAALERVNRAINEARAAIVSECAEPLSAELCWTAKSDPRLAAIVARAAGLIKKAEQALADLPKSVSESERSALQGRIDLLRAFLDLFTAIAALDDSKSSRNRLIDACINVSVYLDDPNPGVADSAKLWQGVAYRRAGRPDRTLQLFWPAIGRVSSTRVDFFVRTERCRALVESGRHVSALALVVKLEEHVGEWIKDEDEASRTLAADSLRWVRAMIHRDWAASLRKDGEPERAKTADEAAAKIVGEESFPIPPKKWLRLSETIAGLPEWKPAEPEPTTQPAEKKS